MNQVIGIGRDRHARTDQQREPAVRAVAALILGLMCGISPTGLLSQSGNWSQWRGPARDGVSPGEAWSASLGPEALREAWRANLGPSYSGTVIGEDAVFVTEQRAGQEGIAALDPATGERAWSRDWQIDFEVPRSAGHGTWPKSTPALAGDDLFYLGLDERLHSLNVATGEAQWSIDFPARFDTPAPEFGSSTSPLILEGSLYVQAAGSLFAIDRETGEVRWRAHNLYDGSQKPGAELETYGSPIAATFGGIRQIVAFTAKGLIGIDADAGTLLWSVDVDGRFQDPPNTTPVLWGESILVTSEDGGTSLYRISAADGRFQAEQVWRHKARSDMSSPVIVGDHAYLHLKNRRMASLDLRTGEHAWISKPGFGQYASLISRDDKILSLSTDGELTLFTTDTEEMSVLDRREIADNAWAHAASDGDRVYVRSLESLIALEWVRAGDR